jgi:hypothetical protein
MRRDRPANDTVKVWTGLLAPPFSIVWQAEHFFSCAWPFSILAPASSGMIDSSAGAPAAAAGRFFGRLDRVTRLSGTGLRKWRRKPGSAKTPRSMWPESRR